MSKEERELKSRASNPAHSTIPPELLEYVGRRHRVVPEQPGRDPARTAIIESLIEGASALVEADAAREPRRGAGNASVYVAPANVPHTEHGPRLTGKVKINVAASESLWAQAAATAPVAVSELPLAPGPSPRKEPADPEEKTARRRVLPATLLAIGVVALLLVGMQVLWKESVGAELSAPSVTAPPPAAVAGRPAVAPEVPSAGTTLEIALEASEVPSAPMAPASIKPTPPRGSNDGAGDPGAPLSVKSKDPLGPLQHPTSGPSPASSSWF